MAHTTNFRTTMDDIGSHGGTAFAARAVNHSVVPGTQAIPNHYCYTETLKKGSTMSEIGSHGGTAFPEKRPNHSVAVGSQAILGHSAACPKGWARCPGNPGVRAFGV